MTRNIPTQERIDRCQYVKIDANKRRGSVMIDGRCVFYGSAAEARSWHSRLATAYIAGFSDGLNTPELIKSFAHTPPTNLPVSESSPEATANESDRVNTKEASIEESE